MYVVLLTLGAALHVACLIPRKLDTGRCIELCNGMCVPENRVKYDDTEKRALCHVAKCRLAFRTYTCSLESAERNTETQVMLPKHVSMTTGIGTDPTRQPYEKGKKKKQLQSLTTLRQNISHCIVKADKFQADFVLIQGHIGKLFGVSLANFEFAKIETQYLGSKCVDGSLVDFSLGKCYWMCGTRRTKHLYYGAVKDDKITFKYKSVRVHQIKGLQADSKANFVFTRRKKSLSRIDLNGKGNLKPKTIFKYIQIEISIFHLIEQERVIFFLDGPNGVLYCLDYFGKQQRVFFENLIQGFSLYMKNEKIWIIKCIYGKIITNELDGKNKRVLYDGTSKCNAIWTFGNNIFVSVKDKIGLWVLQNRSLTRIVRSLVTERKLCLLPLREDVK